MDQQEKCPYCGHVIIDPLVEAAALAQRRADHAAYVKAWRAKKKEQRARREKRS